MNVKKGTNKMRLLGMLLMLCMVASSLPVTAFEFFIYSADVSGITLPVAGQNPSYGVILSNNAAYHVATTANLRSLGYSDTDILLYQNGVLWYNSSDNVCMTSLDTFELGKEYMMEIILVPYSGYRFNEYMDLTMNGSENLVDTNINSGIYLHLYSKKLKPSSAGSGSTTTQLITSADVSDVALPVIGKTPDFDVTLPADAKYHIATPDELRSMGESDEYISRFTNGVYWYNESDSVYMTSSDTFEINKDYTFVTLLLPNTGYVYASNITTTLNGNEELFNGFVNIYGNIYFRSVNIKPIAPTPITDVEIKNVTTPVIGKPCSTNSITVTTTPTNSVDVKEIYWYDETESNPKTSSDQFVVGHKYSIFAKLEPKNEFVFEFDSDSTAQYKPYTGTATVGDEPAERAEQYSTSATGLLIVGKSVEMLSKITKVDITNVPTPLIGRYCSTDGINLTTTPANAAEIKDKRWYDETDDTFKSSEDTFIAGHEYYIYVKLELNTGYTFDFSSAANTDTVIINDEAANVINQYGSNGVLIYGKNIEAKDPLVEYVWLNDGKALSAIKPYLVNGEPAASGTLGSDGCSAYYNVNTGVLKLQNYNGGNIRIGSAGTTANATVMLIGNNTIVENDFEIQKGLTFDSNSTLTITSESGGTLYISVNSLDKSAYGIQTSENSNLVIGGNADLRLYVSSVVKPNGAVYGILCSGSGGSLEITDSASVEVETTSYEGQYTSSYGLYSGGDVKINTEGDVSLDVSKVDNANFGSNTCIYGNATVTNANSLVCKYPSNRGMLFNSNVPTMTDFIESRTVSGGVTCVEWQKQTFRASDDATVTVGNNVTVPWPNGADEFQLYESGGTSAVCSGTKSEYPYGMYIPAQSLPTEKTYYFRVYSSDREKWLYSYYFTLAWKMEITEVNVTNVPIPFVGQTCSTDGITVITTPADAADVITIYWYDKTVRRPMPPTGKFADTHEYSICVGLTPKSDYIFESNSTENEAYIGTATLNGEAASRAEMNNVFLVFIGGSYRNVFREGLSIIGESILAMKDGNITEVAITGVPIPIAGEPCSTDGITITTKPINNIATVWDIYWYDDTDRHNMSQDDNFIDDHEYSIRVELNPMAGLHFEFDYSYEPPYYIGTATVNGETARLAVPPHMTTEYELLIAGKSIKATPSNGATKVSITGVTVDSTTKTVIINSNTEYNNTTVIVAAYKNGKLLHTELKPVNIVNGDNNVIFDNFDTTGADTVKAMVWENSSSIKPLCDVYTKKL